MVSARRHTTRRVAVLAAGTALAAVARAAVAGGDGPSSIPAAVAFALMLLALAVGEHEGPFPSPSRRALLAAAAGAGAGVVLALVPPAARVGIGGVTVGHATTASAAAVWGAATLAVATAEEVVLRGVLFGALRDLGAGGAATVVMTAAVFALIHVPMYGWVAVPLDVAVGLVLGGLRLLTASVAAPVAAHAVADLATWWLL